MATSAVSGLSGITQDQFLRLLMAQLKHQDPSEPMSSSEMVTQMAQLSSLEAMNGLRSSFSAVLDLQRLLGGTQLIGREVEYTLGDLPQRGVVESVSITGDAVRLSVNGYDIKLEDVTRIL